MRDGRIKSWAAGIAVVGVGCLAALVFTLEDVQREVIELLEWVDGLGFAGLLTYTALYIAIVVLLLPGVVFTLGAGFLFGFFVGAIVIVAAVAIGSGIAFLIARYLFGERLTRLLRNHPRAHLLDRGLKKEGWKIVFLSRLVPLFPFKLSNYFFGLTSIPFRHFFLANLAGVVPISLTNVYVGSMAADLAELTRRDAQPWEWALYFAGFAAAVGLIIVITRLARRGIQNALLEEGTDDSEERSGEK